MLLTVDHLGCMVPREIVQRCHFGGKLNPEYLNLLERSDKMGPSMVVGWRLGFFEPMDLWSSGGFMYGSCSAMTHSNIYQY